MVAFRQNLSQVSYKHIVIFNFNYLGIFYIVVPPKWLEKDTRRAKLLYGLSYIAGAIDFIFWAIGVSKNRKAVDLFQYHFLKDSVLYVKVSLIF